MDVITSALEYAYEKPGAVLFLIILAYFIWKYLENTKKKVNEEIKKQH